RLAASLRANDGPHGPACPGCFDGDRLGEAGFSPGFEYGEGDLGGYVVVPAVVAVHGEADDESVATVEVDRAWDLYFNGRFRRRLYLRDCENCEKTENTEHRRHCRGT
ncbi:hypothetical protein PFISCL1PPCAC_28117, partial [Pristionchus fissidentatus]